MTQVLLTIDPARVKPGWLGLVVVVAIAIAMVVLWRSMNHQLKKVDFEQPEDDGDSAPDDEADSSR